MAKTKADFAKMRQKRLKTVESAVNNAVVSLKKMGLQHAKVEVEDEGRTAYILLKVDDLVDVISKKTKKSVKKACGSSVEVVCYKESDVIVIRVRR